MSTRVYTGPEGTVLEVGPIRGPGRPRKPDARRAMVHVRCTEAEREELHARAASAGVNAQELARSLLWPSPHREVDQDAEPGSDPDRDDPQGEPDEHPPDGGGCPGDR